MKRIYSAALFSFAAILICVCILTPYNADWLSVETSSYAVPGINFTVKVKLKNPEPGLMLGVDLHRMDDKKNSHGCFSVSRPLVVKDNETLYEFSLPVPGDKDTSFIFPVIILSRDGSWSGRVKSAESEPVPVQSAEQIPSQIILVQKKTRDNGEKTLQLIPESDLLRFITASLWVFLVVMLLIRRNLHHSPSLILAAAVSALWESFNSSTAITFYLRGIAIYSGAYGLRREPQQFFSILLILTCAAVIIYLIHAISKSYISVILICLSIFWSISLLRILSLHEIDRLLTMTIAGIQTGQLLRLAAAVLSIAALLQLIIKEQENPQPDGNNSFYTDI